MIVSALQIARFRNLAEVFLSPGPELNVLSGDNGQGKTNILEAIYLLATLRSFRTPHTGDAIQHDEATAALQARVRHQGTEHSCELVLHGRNKRLRLDGKVPKSAAAYFGRLNVVLFSPEDLQLPRGSPSGRRRLLDRAVFTRDHAFLTDAQRYARALKARNAILRQGSPARELLAAYDEQLLFYGARVVAARRRFLATMAPAVARVFAAIADSGPVAAVAYDGLEEDFSAAFRAAVRNDLARKMTTVGPHVDDLALTLDGHPARRVASQGQLRALLLAWKIAEIQLLEEAHGEPPVLLLDDVSSELDRQRSEHLFAFLATIRCQCFATTTDPNHLPDHSNRVDFRVLAGAAEVGR